jgi:hypothetical protein
VCVGRKTERERGGFRDLETFPDRDFWMCF